MERQSHPTRGAWIEIVDTEKILVYYRSHPTRGAWIEISYGTIEDADDQMSHPTRGAWIEITAALMAAQEVISRTPHGVRGLKSTAGPGDLWGGGVAPHTGCVD